MSIPTRRFTIVPIVMIVGIALVGATPPPVITTDSDVALLTRPLDPSAFQACNATCFICPGDDDHATATATQYASHHHDHPEDCNGEPDCTSHSCELFDASVSDVWKQLRDAFEQRDVVDLTGVGQGVRYNEERGAVQIYCRRGYIVASVPVAREFVVTD